MSATTPTAADAALAARSHAADVLDAWNAAVLSWRWCWHLRRTLGYDHWRTKRAEDKMHADGLAVSRLSGWTVCGPAGAGNGE